MQPLVDGFGAILTPSLLLWCLFGVAVGTLVGVLPGLGPNAGIALLLPLTLTMDPLPALVILMGVIFGANYGISTSAILLNIPGDSSAAATLLDGYPMARKGRPGPALAIAAISSTFASLISIAGIAVLSPLIAPLAVDFGQIEIFDLALIGLTFVASLSPDRMRGYAMAGLGLVLTLPGTDPITGQSRFTFGMDGLLGGLSIVPVVMGIFAIGQLLYSMQNVTTKPAIQKLGRLMPTREDMRYSLPAMVRGTGLGFFIGLLPGAGSTPAAFAAYGVEAKVAKRRSKFGTGMPEGVAAPEAANNGAAAGAYVPLLTLGIPGSAPTAVLLGVMIVLGARPGPLFLDQQPDLFWGLIAAMVLGTIFLLILNLPLVGMWASILRVPFPLLLSGLFVICITGVYSLNNSQFDVWVTLAFGLLGYILIRFKYPLAPLVLGFVLGPFLEHNLRQALVIHDGSLMPFLTKPVSLALLILVVLMVASPALRRLFASSRKRVRS